MVERRDSRKLPGQPFPRPSLLVTDLIDGDRAMSSPSLIAASELADAQSAIATAIAAIGEALVALQTAAAAVPGVNHREVAASAAAVSAATSAIAAVANQIAIDPQQALAVIESSAATRNCGGRD
jgi:hypothetical protein